VQEPQARTPTRRTNTEAHTRKLVRDQAAQGRYGQEAGEEVAAQKLGPVSSQTELPADLRWKVDVPWRWIGRGAACHGLMAAVILDTMSSTIARRVLAKTAPRASYGSPGVAGGRPVISIPDGEGAPSRGAADWDNSSQEFWWNRPGTLLVGARLAPRGLP
jgi:hypothetical protein